MNIARLIFAAAMIALLGACAPSAGTAPEVATPEIYEVPASGSIVRIGDVNVPLPEGVWANLGRTSITEFRNYPVYATVLVSRTEAAVDRTIMVWEQRALAGRSFGAFSRCADDANLYNNGGPYGPGSADCFYLRDIAWQNDPATGRKMHDYGRSRAVFSPLVTVGPRIVLNTSAQARFAIDYGFTVDLLLPPTSGYSRPGDWSRAAVATNPAKKAVVDGLIPFARRMQDQVRRANAPTS